MGREKRLPQVKEWIDEVSLRSRGRDWFPAYAQTLDFTTVDTRAERDSQSEKLQAAIPDLTQEQFIAADADGSGNFSPDAFATLAGG